jgi:GLPGLI family protein
MKTLQCLILITVFYSQLKGQMNTDMKIEYQVRFNDAFDRGRKDRMHTGYLFIQGSISRFYMIANEKYQSSGEYDQTFDPDTNIQVYTDQSKSLMIAREFSFNGQPFNLIDSLYPMQWEIGNETKYIDSFSCTRATCYFRGRNYEAWFSPDIPVPLGPWKMGGLPGLILDLKDEDENMLISLKHIRYGNYAIQIPADSRYSMAEHIATMKKFFERLQGNARTSGSWDCVSCQTQSKFELVTWEKIPR